MAAVEEPGHDHVGPNDAVHRNFNESVRDVLQGKVDTAARKVMRDALDQAGAPMVGRKKSDAAIGRISRLG